MAYFLFGKGYVEYYFYAHDHACSPNLMTKNLKFTISSGDKISLTKLCFNRLSQPLQRVFSVLSFCIFSPGPFLSCPWPSGLHCHEYHGHSFLLSSYLCWINRKMNSSCSAVDINSRI